MGVRKLMDFIFSPLEMYWLDHMLPGEERIKKEDQVIHRFTVQFCFTVGQTVKFYARAHTYIRLL